VAVATHVVRRGSFDPPAGYVDRTQCELSESAIVDRGTGSYMRSPMEASGVEVSRQPRLPSPNFYFRIYPPSMEMRSRTCGARSALVTVPNLRKAR
jgi:hypothetical protein